MEFQQLPDDVQMVQIEVGEIFPLFQDSIKKHKGEEFAVFEASDFNQGYMFCCHLPDARDYEIEAFRNSPIQMRVVMGDDNMVIPMVKIGKHFIYEIVFDPTLYGDDRALQFIQSNNILSLFLINSNNGKLLAIRQSNFPLKMIQICKESWSRAILDLDFSRKFSDWYRHLQENYFLDAMWDRATYVGKMGETYNLDDIKIPTVKNVNNA